jgi:glycosyltransferase involved in cell wall biosynthesis
MVVGAYYPELAGGSLQCRTLVTALRDRVRFSILTTTIERGLPALSDVDDVPVHRVFVDVGSPLAKVAAAMRMLRLTPALAARHDIFHFHGFTEKMLLLLGAAKLAGRPTIEKTTSLGWDDPIAIRSRPLGRMLAAGVARVDRLVAVSPAIAARCRDAGLAGNRVEEIPNGVDTARFAPVDAAARAALRARLDLPADATVVTFVGFWSREKGPHLLFDAWRMARASTGLNTVLLYIGSTDPAHAEVDADIVGAVRQRLQSESLGPSVRFVERTTDVASYLQASDIFAVPSSREGLSNALLEAMATGLPCAIATIPGVTDAVIASGSNGFAVPAGDVGALRDALARLMADGSLRQEVGRRARQTIVDRFAIGAIADRYFSLYSGLIAPA